ncbi:murein biosynthesis integral membrane protein MurJ [Peptoniphilus mikwangii]|uniref:murein biosynthesis integral membrane protein MurJ n=1 Tax=Peptoniphilus mikwangii TaxID=1354300 RepID=UPI0004078DF0|nr:murein biosynthesis integral membrane protein MurJ [Peptoniphilus mikwangii]
MKTSYILMIVTIISKIFGLAREKALAYFFGTSLVADVFIVAFRIPMTFTNVVSGTTANGFIPIYNDIAQSNGEENAKKFTSNLSNIVFLFTFVLSIFGIIFAKPIVNIMAIGFDTQELELCIFMTRVSMFSICSTSVFSIFKAYLQIKKSFVVSICHSIIMNLIIMASMAFAYKFGKEYLAWGILTAFIFQYVIFLPYIRKHGYRHFKLIDFKDENFIKMLKIILPVLISTSVIELNFIISNSLASSLPGAISKLNYAYKLQSFVTGIVITSITTAVYPEMARLGAKKDYDGLKLSIADSIITMLLLVVPASVGLFLFSEPIVKILFVGGAFSKQDATSTAIILSLYAIGIIGIGFREIISRVFYTIMDAKTPVINSVVMVAINVVLSFILINSLGPRGLALATSISFMAGAVLILISLRKRMGRIFSADTVREIIKIIIATAVMGIVSKFCYIFLSKGMGNLIAFLISVIAAGTVYLIMLVLLKVKEVRNIIGKIKK